MRVSPHMLLHVNTWDEDYIDDFEENLVVRL